MPKARITLTIDEEVLRAVRIKAARTGQRESAVIEESLRRDLGWDVLERLWEQADLDPDSALELALEAQRETGARG